MEYKFTLTIEQSALICAKLGNVIDRNEQVDDREVKQIKEIIDILAKPFGFDAEELATIVRAFNQMEDIFEPKH